MPIKSQKSSKNERIDYVVNNELKSDLKRIIIITLVSIGLSFITYRLDTCFEETLFCTALAIISTVIIGILYFIRKSRTRS